MKKVRMSSFWGLSVCILLGIISCKKDHGYGTPPSKPGNELIVITTGEIFNTANNSYVPYYWVNEQRHPLEMNIATQAFPYGIEKAGNDLYIAGSYSNDTRNQFPCYWKNGQKKDLPVDGLPVNELYGARDVKWFNNALYVLGDASLRPVIWKIKGNDVTMIEIKGATAAIQDMVVAMNLEVYNNQLYFAGAQDMPKAGGGFTFEAGYWTLDVNDDYQFHAMESNLNYSLVYSMAVSGKGVFLTGERANTAFGAGPAVWGPNGQLDIVNQVNPNNQQLNEVVIDSKGKLYFNVFNFSRNRPLVWKVTGASFEPLEPVVPAEARGDAKNLAIKDDHFAYAYDYRIGQQFFAGYNFDGKDVPFKTDSLKFLNINRTGIFPK